MPKIPEGQLSPKQAKFVKLKSQGLNGTQAAIQAYDTDKPNVAKNIASENMAKPNVKAAIEKEMEKQGLTLEKIIQPVTRALDAPDLDMQLKGHDRAVRLMSFGQKKEDPSTTLNLHLHQAQQRDKYDL